MAGPRDSGEDGGAKIQMTRAWKDSVLAELSRRGWNVERLAEEIGVSRSLGYRLFPTKPADNEIWSSTAVPDVCALLGLPPPLQAVVDETDRKILELVRELPNATKVSLVQLIESLLNSGKL